MSLVALLLQLLWVGTFWQFVTNELVLWYLNDRSISLIWEANGVIWHFMCVNNRKIFTSFIVFSCRVVAGAGSRCAWWTLNIHLEFSFGCFAAGCVVLKHEF